MSLKYLPCISHIYQNQLSHIIFPLGDMDKTEVKIIAKNLNLKIEEKSIVKGFIYSRAFFSVSIPLEIRSCANKSFSVTCLIF